MPGGGDTLETGNPSASPFFPGAQVGLVQEHLVQAGMLTFFPPPVRFLTVKLRLLYPSPPPPHPQLLFLAIPSHTHTQRLVHPGCSINVN